MMEDTLDGLDAFHGLISHDGAPEFLDLLEDDVDQAHRSAHLRNAGLILDEAWTLRPVTFTDTNMIARILEIEEENGVRWAA